MIVSAREGAVWPGRRSEPSTRMLFGLVSMLPALSSEAFVAPDSLVDWMCALIMKRTKLSTSQPMIPTKVQITTRRQLTRWYHGPLGGRRLGSLGGAGGGNCPGGA